MVLKDDMFIYLYCFLYAYDIISLVPHYVSYISIVLVLLLYIIASFILSLTRSLSDDPGFACPDWRSAYRSIREDHGVTSELPHRDYS